MRRKVKGSILLESAVAVTIIAICIALSFAHISRLLSYDKTATRLKAREVIQRLSEENDGKDKILEFEGFSVEQLYMPYEHMAGLYEMELTVRDAEDGIILTEKRLVRK